MWVRATRSGDVRIGRTAKALFSGQIYDIPDEIVERTPWLIPVTTEAKAITGPPSTKAVGGPENVKAPRGNR